MKDAQRAARLAGLVNIPTIVRDLDDILSSNIQSIENIQREDLNPIEEALAYQNLIEQYNMTQEELAEKLGKSRSAIANTMRLLNLADEVNKS